MYINIVFVSWKCNILGGYFQSGWPDSRKGVLGNNGSKDPALLYVILITDRHNVELKVMWCLKNGLPPQEISRLKLGAFDMYYISSSAIVRYVKYDIIIITLNMLNVI